ICLKSMESQSKHHGNPESDQGRHALGALFCASSAINNYAIKPNLHAIYGLIENISYEDFSMWFENFIKLQLLVGCVAIFIVSSVTLVNHVLTPKRS
ncbi:hypothetical protein, partial [Roseovarius gahaiensis]|uniref:hypothetical protein n=1 Tax=Roseovarius gahaiensis TaxID=2716691 RepID=UPI001E60B0BE